MTFQIDSLRYWHNYGRKALEAAAFIACLSRPLSAMREWLRSTTTLSNNSSSHRTNINNTNGETVPLFTTIHLVS